MKVIEVRVKVDSLWGPGPVHWGQARGSSLQGQPRGRLSYGQQARVAVMGVSPGGRNLGAKPEGPVKMELRVRDSLGWQREFFQEKEPVQESGGWGSLWEVSH